MKVTIMVFLCCLISGCSTGNKITIYYSFGQNVDSQIGREILFNYFTLPNNKPEDGPVFVEKLPEEWRANCHTSEHLSKVLGKFCASSYIVTQQAKSEGLNFQHLVLKSCGPDGCIYKIDSRNIGPE